MSKIHVVADLRFKEEALEKVLPLLKKLVSDTQKEKGCISYELVEDTKNTGIFFTIEVWENQAALDTHLNSENIKTILGTATQYFAAAPDIHQCKKLY